MISLSYFTTKRMTMLHFYTQEIHLNGKFYVAWLNNEQN